MSNTRVGTMLGDLVRSLVTPPMTQKYPFEKQPTPERLRGRLEWNPSECIGCNLCVKDCPSNALELITLDKKAKKFVVKYSVDRCTFCAQCVESCRRGCLRMMSTRWELASSDKDEFTLYFGAPENVSAVLAEGTDSPTEQSGG